MTHVLVIGGSVIGICCALELQNDGHTVTIIDRDAPVLELYDNRDDLQHARVFHDIRRNLGFQIDEISSNEATEMEPSIAGDFACAAVFRDWRSIVDGKRFVIELHKVFVERGGSVEHAEVSRLIKDADNVTAVKTTESRYFKADQIVIAAGAWSKKLAASIGISLQIEGVIGYQTTLESPEVEVNHGIVYAAGGFGITPYESGLAIGGSIEFAGLNATPNWKRADVLVEKARRVLPGLCSNKAKKRIGRRPLTPDTKPIIGRVPIARNVILATGHGQLGLTLGATTALLVSDLVASRPSRIDIAALKPDRF